jgi:hypothetical protein
LNTTNTSFVLNVNSATNHLNRNLVRMFALNVEALVDDKKYSEASQIRVEKGLAGEIHRKKRAKDSYQCYLAYMSLRERDRWEK